MRRVDRLVREAAAVTPVALAALECVTGALGAAAVAPAVTSAAVAATATATVPTTAACQKRNMYNISTLEETEMHQRRAATL